MPEDVLGLLSRVLAVVPTEAVLLVLETALQDAGFPPAMAANRSSLLFTCKQKRGRSDEAKIFFFQPV